MKESKRYFYLSVFFVLLSFTHPRDPELLVMNLYEEGLQHYAAKDWKRAKKSFEKVIQLKPNYLSTKIYLAEIKERLGEREFSKVW